MKITSDTLDINRKTAAVVGLVLIAAILFVCSLWTVGARRTPLLALVKRSPCLDRADSTTVSWNGLHIFGK